MENFIADHLSHLLLKEELMPLKDEFPNEHLFLVTLWTLWYADIVNYLVTNTLPAKLSRAQKDRIKKNNSNMCEMTVQIRSFADASLK